MIIRSESGHKSCIVESNRLTGISFRSGLLIYFSLFYKSLIVFVFGSVLLITSWENLGRSFLGTISSLRSTIRFLNDSNVSGLTLPQSRKLVAKIGVVNLISGSGMLVLYYKCLVLKCEEIKNRFRFIGKIKRRKEFFLF